MAILKAKEDYHKKEKLISATNKNFEIPNL